MTRVKNLKRAGGPGLGSNDVGLGCGLHKNWASNATLFDPSGGASTEHVRMCPTKGRVQAAYVTINEAVATNSKVFTVGKIAADGTATAAAFGTITVTTTTGTSGAVLPITLTATAIAAGDVLTVTSTNVAGAGTGWVTVEFTIDDEE